MNPFVTEVVIESELPRLPAISIGVVLKPASMVFRFSDESTQERTPFLVISLVSLVGFEFAFGLTEGVMKTVGRNREATVETVAATVVSNKQ